MFGKYSLKRSVWDFGNYPKKVVRGRILTRPKQKHTEAIKIHCTETSKFIHFGITHTPVNYSR